MSSPILGSILLGSSDPERLKQWYLDALRPTENQYGFLQFGAVSILIDGRDDVAARTAEPGRVLLNFHVDDAEATARHLTELGASWVAELEQRRDGLFGTVTDPDGNYVQIIQLSAEYLASVQ
ncbi:VOC family protein [Kutzneria kofuensis]|uniref:Putative enzyme related to lactoylglutathione lyase n=1 Tax=Kutzneria kofuensis TaxID=103725 RepID=A0A7W9KPL3_9PSEU|nr:VOC family protein [Kutzneria kofuensis]MBB5896290.1 putative enzyme related to lactoylglutathione lyase [Kutzneria kofuensis]